jgi:hypothetical protein
MAQGISEMRQKEVSCFVSRYAASSYKQYASFLTRLLQIGLRRIVSGGLASPLAGYEAS